MNWGQLGWVTVPLLASLLIWTWAGSKSLMLPGFCSIGFYSSLPGSWSYFPWWHVCCQCRATDGHLSSLEVENMRRNRIPYTVFWLLSSFVMAFFSWVINPALTANLPWEGSLAEGWADPEKQQGSCDFPYSTLWNCVQGNPLSDSNFWTSKFPLCTSLISLSEMGSFRFVFND